MNDAMVKVLFELDPSDWHGHGSETVWAEPIQKESATFRILNSPFFTRGINYLDVVRASPIAGSYEVYNFEAIADRSGHSTFMILLQPGDPRNDAYWNMLEGMGCSYESGNIDLSIGRRLLYSVDVPPSAEIYEVYEMLERGVADNVWIFQEGFANPAALKSQD